MEMIASYLEIKVNLIREELKHPQYRVRTSSVSTNQILRNYIEKYPHYESKYLDYKDWCKILSYFEKETHWQNVYEISKIKSQMNQYRTVFRGGSFSIVKINYDSKIQSQPVCEYRSIPLFLPLAFAC
jgi:hypothetical protein